MLVMMNLLCGVSAAALMSGEIAPPLNWVTGDQWTPSGVAANWNGRTIRIRISPNTIAMVGDRIRIQFTAAPSGLQIASCYIGHGAVTGNSYDFFDTPQRVLFGGSNGFSIGADANILSDAVAMDFDPTRNLIIAFYIASGAPGDDLVEITTKTGWDTFYKFTGATDDSATVDATLYSNSLSAAMGVTRIDVVPLGAESETNVVVPYGTITEGLLNFPVRLDLADMPLAFWDGVTSDGGNIRIRNSENVDVPFDLVRIDAGTQTGELFFRAARLRSPITSLFKVATVPGAIAPAVGAANGRNAVWSDYHAVFMFTSLENRTGVTGRNATMVGTAGTYPFGPTATSPSVNVHQGVAWDGTHFYAIDTDKVQKYTSAWATVGSPFLLSSIGTPGVNHFGDGTIHGGELFIVYELYPNSPYNNQHVAVLDPATMTLLRTYDISAQAHEVAGICWDATNNCFVIADYTRADRLHRYDEDFNYLGAITTASTSDKQGIEYYGGYLWVTTRGKRLYRFNPDGTGRSLQWSGSISGYMEGIAAKGDGSFYILFDGTPSSVYTFSPSGSAGIPGWLNIDGNGNALAAGMSQLTNWTMGASIVPLNVAGNGAILSYTPPVSSNSFRASLVLRGLTGQYGIWNSTDTWLEATSAPPSISSRHRLHHTQNGTVDRKIWVNGALSATDTGVAQRPGNSGGTWSLFIGGEDNDYSERMIGSINYAYLRNGVLSAGWLAAEYKSWETDTFYDFDYDLSLGRIMVSGQSLYGIAGDAPADNTIRASRQTLYAIT